MAPRNQGLGPTQRRFSRQENARLKTTFNCAACMVRSGVFVDESGPLPEPCKLGFLLVTFRAL